MLCTRSILTYVRFGILWVYQGISPSILSSVWEALQKGEKLAVQRLLLEKKIHFTVKKLRLGENVYAILIINSNLILLMT